MILIAIAGIITTALVILRMADLISHGIVMIGLLLSAVLVVINIITPKARTAPDTERPNIPPGIPHGYQPVKGSVAVISNPLQNGSGVPKANTLPITKNNDWKSSLVFDEKLVIIPTLISIRIYNSPCAGKQCKECDFFTINNRFQFKYGETCARNAIRNLISDM